MLKAGTGYISKTAALLAMGLLIVASRSIVFADGKEAEKATEPLSRFELAKYTYCGDDRDCVKAVNGCCDCANGGADVAVNKDRLKDFRDRFDCLYVQCGDEERNPPCGSGVITCVNHRCQYIPPDRVRLTP